MIDCVNCGEVFWFDDFMNDSIGIKCKCGNIDLSVHKESLFDINDKMIKRKHDIQAQIKDLREQLIELCKYAV